MAYTSHGNTGNRDSHGWAIAGAFAGQAAIIVGIGALLTGAGPTAAVTQVSAAPAPAVAKPVPAFSAMPGIQPFTDFSYQVMIDGQSAGAVFPAKSPPPLFIVKPGQDLTITLNVTVPSMKSVTDLSVSLIGVATDAVPLSPGTHVFTLSWPGTASELRPGTRWLLFMSAGTPDGRDIAPIATVTVAS